MRVLRKLFAPLTMIAAAVALVACTSTNVENFSSEPPAAQPNEAPPVAPIGR